jgi:hypothetical protein
MIRMYLKTIVTITGLALMLTGCITPYQYAKGPMDLEPGVDSGLHQWSQMINPRTFAVTPDGDGYGASYCPEMRCSGHEEAIALDSCQRKNDVECIIYGQDGRYVWNGEKIK